MDQTRTPLIDALASFSRTNRGYFNIPGHHGARGVDESLLSLFGTGVFEADRTETDGLDDLHAAAGPIREAQMLAAGLFGSDRCWFVVNGTTAANQAMILSAAGPGDKILVPRNAHKSVLMGLILSGAVPVWIMPEQEADSGLYGAPDPEKILEALDGDPGIKAVFLVSPTYYGSCADLAGIADIAHAHGVPLLADEAHGAHFYFHEAFPSGAVSAGADLTAQSTHKTLGSMTQSSMLHWKKHVPMDADRIEDSLKLVQSTSPSYPLMASLDGTRHLMAKEGEALQEHALRLAELAASELSGIPGVEVLHRTGTETGSYDPCRIVFTAASRGVTGLQIQEALSARHVTVEMADPSVVVLVITHAGTAEEIRLLAQVVRETVEGASADTEYAKNGRCVSLFVPPAGVTPREAFFGKKETVPLKAASGRLAGEMIAPYPPGIPLICPGEVITPEICEELELCRSLHLPVHGAADPSLETLRVLKG